MAMQREGPGGWEWGSAQLGHTTVRCTVRLGLATAPLRPAALPADVGQEVCTGEAGVVWIYQLVFQKENTGSPLSGLIGMSAGSIIPLVGRK